MSRRQNDDYPTHKALLQPLLRLGDRQLVRGTVFEPCAGGGQLASGLRQAGLEVHTNDIDARYNTLHNFDIRNRSKWIEVMPFQWVVTNPPYSVLEPLMKYSLAYASRGVALLLRLSAYEPANTKVKRGEILMSYQDNMRYLMAFSSPRPRYDPTKRGSDSVTTAWFVWDKGWSWKAHGLECPFQFITEWL